MYQNFQLINFLGALKGTQWNIKNIYIKVQRWVIVYVSKKKMGYNFVVELILGEQNDTF